MDMQEYTGDACAQPILTVFEREQLYQEVKAAEVAGDSEDTDLIDTLPSRKPRVRKRARQPTTHIKKQQTPNKRHKTTRAKKDWFRMFQHLKQCNLGFAAALRGEAHEKQQPRVVCACRECGLLWFGRAVDDLCGGARCSNDMFSAK